MNPIYPMSKKKLTSESLENARILIQQTIYEAMDEMYTSPELWEHRKEVYEAWNLLCEFGNLDDLEDIFEEYAYQYNRNHGLE